MTSPHFPAAILIVRHGEKPGDNSDPHLNDVGRVRADMLAKTFPSLYPNLAVLFAAAASTNSNRSYETIEPLAKAMRLVVNNSFSNGQHSELAEYILRGSEDYGGKTILICWHHEKIPVLARDDLGQEGAPTFWSDDVFDQIWQIDYSSDGHSTFTINAEPPIST